MLGWKTVQKQSGLASQPSTEAGGARLSPWSIFQEAGFYETPYSIFPKLQIYTIKELSAELNQKLPWIGPTSFKKAAREVSWCSDDLDL
jgi:hypothetical protein